MRRVRDNKKRGPKGIVIKLSGEDFSGKESPFDHKKFITVAEKLGNLTKKYAVYVVVGGGNICRGKELEAFELEDLGADRVGMTSALQNALLLKELINSRDYGTAHVMAPFEASALGVHPYAATKAKTWAKMGHIVIFGAGLGLCGLTTDTTAVQRACEVGASLVVKSTSVGGLFDDDPKKNAHAKMFNKITATEVLQKGLKAMDTVAFQFALDNKIIIKIVGFENIIKSNFMSASVGTTITP